MHMQSFAAVTISLALAACGSTRFVPSAPPTQVPGVISVWGAWIKDKGDKFDVSLNLRNESGGMLVVLLSDIDGARGDAAGAMRHVFFGAGERAIDLRGGQTKAFTMSCKLGRHVDAGDFRVILRRVYDNPSRDGRTPGSLVASDVTWTSR